MKITTPKSQQVYNWLLARGISSTVIEQSKLDWNGQEIVIPIFDRNGIFLFNKYRRDPFIEDDTNVPKYRYEKGSQATLYNAHTIKDLKNSIIFLTEGELDTLRLNSLGLHAISSTGGANTVRPEWISLLGDNEIYIIYDNDNAGIKGALKVNEFYPHAKIVFLPYMNEGKDLTDYFKKHTIREFEELVSSSSSWVLTSEPKEIPETKIATHQVIKAYQEESEILLEKQRVLNGSGKSFRHIEMLMEEIEDRIIYWRKHYENLSKKFPAIHLRDENKMRAKTVPITNYIKFNGAGFAPCLWHNDGNPSLHYIEKSNRVYCFSCNANKDVIDVVMELNKVEFKEALKMILGTSTPVG